MNGTILERAGSIAIAVVSLASVAAVMNPGRQSSRVIAAMGASQHQMLCAAMGVDPKPRKPKCGRMMYYPAGNRMSNGWSIVSCEIERHENSPWHADDNLYPFHEDDARWFNEQYIGIHYPESGGPDSWEDCRFRPYVVSPAKTKPNRKGAAR